MQCEICGNKELRGELEVEDYSTEDMAIVAVVETSPRNWILCDSCNMLVCHDCCDHPKTGYCDTCIDLYKLHDLIREYYPQEVEV